MWQPHLAGALLLVALPALAEHPPKLKTEVVAGSGLVRADRAGIVNKGTSATIPELEPFAAPALAKRSVPFVRPKPDFPTDTFEVVFFARLRPVRVRVIVRQDGVSTQEKWDATLKKLFQAFDRDGDGRLNEAETELVFSLGEMRTMLSGSLGYRGIGDGVMPNLQRLDRDGDKSISFNEFAHYYDELIGQLLRPRETPGYAGPDAITPELFARLDLNNDKKLSEAELKNAEKLLLALDGDEDDCVSAFEITSNPVRNKIPILSPGGTDRGMDTMARPGQAVANVQTDLFSYRGPIPGSIVKALIKRYDKDGDYELDPKEIAFDQAWFDKFDKNQDGSLEAKELDRWRTGPPDFAIELNVGPTSGKCKAKVVKIEGGDTGGIDFVEQSTPDRQVIRIGGQTLDLGATPVRGTAGIVNPYAGFFPTGRDFVTENDLVGPQSQMLRVLFDPADWDGDGKLTRAEFEKYFALQHSVIGLSLSLTHQIRVPNLFALLDSNNDGKLSVRELRSAYERLIPLEPTGGKLVTRAILQPSAVIRLGHVSSGAMDPNLIPPPSANPYLSPAAPNANAAGPTWFRKMDRNGDGDVSRSEFLGPKDAFDAIDTNRDGLITLEEAEAADKRPRK